MKNQFGICNICKGTNVESMIEALQKIDATAKIDIRCQNLCGIGRTKPFVIVNHIPVIADTEEELIKKVKEMLEEEK